MAVGLFHADGVIPADVVAQFAAFAHRILTRSGREIGQDGGMQTSFQPIEAGAGMNLRRMGFFEIFGGIGAAFWRLWSRAFFIVPTLSRGNNKGECVRCDK
ncbi:hypothetical protein JT25_018945 [Methylomonas denitrificans]|uniref:Uncharacterized protein n=1 Tax=Methylomonas denitrificans TaxID=1538553 RepID=A0A126T8Z9_9GAMM|nr:hypothetical protein JT25_018945 [Methylomonas denitrificans]